MSFRFWPSRTTSLSLRRLMRLIWPMLTLYFVERIAKKYKVNIGQIKRINRLNELVVETIDAFDLADVDLVFLRDPLDEIQGQHRPDQTHQSSQRQARCPARPEPETHSRRSRL